RVSHAGQLRFMVDPMDLAAGGGVVDGHLHVPQGAIRSLEELGDLFEPAAPIERRRLPGDGGCDGPARTVELDAPHESLVVVAHEVVTFVLRGEVARPARRPAIDPSADDRSGETDAVVRIDRRRKAWPWNVRPAARHEGHR